MMRIIAMSSSASQSPQTPEPWLTRRHTRRRKEKFIDKFTTNNNNTNNNNHNSNNNDNSYYFCCIYTHIYTNEILTKEFVSLCTALGSVTAGLLTQHH
jgi:hypothetical protein